MNLHLQQVGKQTKGISSDVITSYTKANLGTNSPNQTQEERS